MGSYIGFADNTLKITIGNGTGGSQTFAIPHYGSQGLAEIASSSYIIHQTILSYLNSAWGVLLGKSMGELQTAVTGTGQGSFGSV